MLTKAAIAVSLGSYTVQCFRCTSHPHTSLILNKQTLAHLISERQSLISGSLGWLTVCRHVTDIHPDGIGGGGGGGGGLAYYSLGYMKAASTMQYRISERILEQFSRLANV